jgi:hypothetical protein
MKGYILSSASFVLLMVSIMLANYLILASQPLPSAYAGNVRMDALQNGISDMKAVIYDASQDTITKMLNAEDGTGKKIVNSCSDAGTQLGGWKAPQVAADNVSTMLKDAYDMDIGINLKASATTDMVSSNDRCIISVDYTGSSNIKANMSGFINKNEPLGGIRLVTDTTRAVLVVKRVR